MEEKRRLPIINIYDVYEMYPEFKKIIEEEIEEKDDWSIVDLDTRYLKAMNRVAASKDAEAPAEAAH